MLTKATISALIASSMVTLANSACSTVMGNVAASVMDLMLCAVCVGAVYLLETMGEAKAPAFIMEEV